MSTNSLRASRTIALLATTTAVATTGIATLVSPTHAMAAPATASAAGWVGVQVQAPKTHTATIELLRPTGQRAASLTVGTDEQLVQVSNDGRRVLTSQYRTNTETWRVHDLTTHRTTAFTANYASVRFTGPSGNALLAQPFRPGGVGTASVQRIDFSGRRQVTYAGTEGGSYMPSLDGRFLVGTNASNRLVVNANATGRRLRVLTSPRGYDFCLPVRNDSASSFLATCTHNGQDGVSQVFRFSLGGGTPVSLTGTLPAGRFGYVDRWVEPSGTWVHAGAGCGSGPLLKVQGRSVRPARLAAKGALLDVVGNRAYVDGGECDQAGGVQVANLSTGSAVTLVRSTPARLLTGLVIVDPTN